MQRISGSMEQLPEMMIIKNTHTFGRLEVKLVWTNLTEKRKCHFCHLFVRKKKGGGDVSAVGRQRQDVS